MTNTDLTGQQASLAEMASALRILIGKLRRRFRDQASMGDLPWPQVSALRLLESQGPVTVTALAKLEGMRPQSMGATVAALQAAGRVSGAPDPADGRQILLSITPACKAWISAGRAAREDWLHRTIEARLSTREQAQLSRAIELLNRLVEE